MAWVVWCFACKQYYQCGSWHYRLFVSPKPCLPARSRSLNANWESTASKSKPAVIRFLWRIRYYVDNVSRQRISNHK